MKKTKVSYLVALYNKEKFIEECINSILAENSSEIVIEICIVDDGSYDDSLELIKSKYHDNPHVKIASFPKNRGKNAAYNKAFSMCTGDYICIFGADDVVVPNRTMKLLEQSKLFNKSVYGKEIKCIENRDKIEEVMHQTKSLAYNRKYSNISFDDIIMQNSLGGGNSFLKRDHVKRIFPIPEHLKFEDWWISYHLTRNNWVVASNDIVSIYRIHSSNDCASIGNKYEAIKRDYLRHKEYLYEFKNIALSEKESFLIEKSLALRESFLGDKRIRYLKYFAFDKTFLKILVFSTYGSKRYYDSIDKVKFFKNIE